MQALNLPTYSFKIKSDGERKLIFDCIRKKYVNLSPEEWVRQHFIRFMIDEKNYPESLTRVEAEIKVNQLSLRGDIVFYDRAGNAMVIVECKAPHIRISQETFDQIARYNINLRVNYLIVTNGIQHFCCRIYYDKNEYVFVKHIPDFKELIP